MAWVHTDAWRPWRDDDDTALAGWLQPPALPAKPGTVAAAVHRVANDQPHQPVGDYLDGVVWDGIRRLDTWLEVCLGVAQGEGGNPAYVRAVGRKWLISAVARAYRPG